VVLLVVVVVIVDAVFRIMGFGFIRHAAEEAEADEQEHGVSKGAAPAGTVGAMQEEEEAGGDKEGTHS
jgi:hypothetical protein